jgi:molybdopterin-guanine dinucleotide biosynthesis protein
VPEPSVPSLIPPPCPENLRLDARAHLKVRRVIGVCGTGSNAGKTTAAEVLIRTAAQRGLRVGALKVTRAHTGECPVGDTSCLVCGSAGTSFRIVDHGPTLARAGKDTGRYVAAGATHVLWLITSPESVRASLQAVLARFPELDVLIAEGNSFCDYVAADALLLVVGEHAPKPSTQPLLSRVTHVLSAEADRATLASRGLPLPQSALLCDIDHCVQELLRSLAP